MECQRKVHTTYMMKMFEIILLVGCLCSFGSVIWGLCWQNVLRVLSIA